MVIHTPVWTQLATVPSSYIKNIINMDSHDHIIDSQALVWQQKYLYLCDTSSAHADS